MPQIRHREYETIYILRPDTDEAMRTGVRDRIEGIVEGRGGHVLKFDDWGQRELSYEIRDAGVGKRFSRGVYHYYRYISPDNSVAEIERSLRLIDGVLKFMTVKIDEDLIAEERLARPEEEEVEIVPYQGDEE